MKKIALFGGSFDPPHNGHIAIVEKALEQLDVDRVIVVPTYLNPFKSGMHAPALQRLEWLRTIFATEPRVEVSDFEVAQERPVPTIETVQHYAGEAQTRYLIIGADNLASLETWYRFEELNRMVNWVVATRGTIEIPERYTRLDIRMPVSSTELRSLPDIDHLPNKVAEEIELFYKENHARTH